MSVLGFNAAMEKQPSEQLTVKANFADVAANLAEGGYSLASCNVAVFDNTGADESNNMIEGTPTVNSNNSWVFACFKGGSDGKNYVARFRTVFSKNGQPNQTPERDLLIKVREEGF